MIALSLLTVSVILLEGVRNTPKGYSAVMAEWVQQLMDSMGYLGILLLMILENLFPPIPSELILPSAGFAASRGDMSFIGVVLMGMIGSVIGTMPLYFIGRAFGEERLIAWADKYGRWLTVSGKDIRKADAWFDKHGPKAVLFGRMVPGIRSLLSLPAGMSEMPLTTFIIFSAIGSGLWSALLTGAGYLLGENYEKVEQYVGPSSKIIVGILAVAFIGWWLRRSSIARSKRALGEIES